MQSLVLLLHLAFQGVLFADQSGAPSTVFARNLIEYKKMACDKYLLAGRLSSSLSYQALVEELARLSPHEGHVLLLRGGRGEFAMQNSKAGSIHRHALPIPVYHPHFFFSLDPVREETSSMTADEFRSALGWRLRPSPERSKAGRVLQAAELFWREPQASIDPVHARSKNHNYIMQMVWRYTVNSLSDESYQLLRFLIRKNEFEADQGLVAVDSALEPINIKHVSSQIWQSARKLGYPLKLSANEYGATELEEILRSYEIESQTIGEGLSRVLLFQWDKRSFQFFLKRSDLGQWVFIKVADDLNESSF